MLSLLCMTIGCPSILLFLNQHPASLLTWPTKDHWYHQQKSTNLEQNCFIIISSPRSSPPSCWLIAPMLSFQWEILAITRSYSRSSPLARLRRLHQVHVLLFPMCNVQSPLSPLTGPGTKELARAGQSWVK